MMLSKVYLDQIRARWESVRGMAVEIAAGPDGHAGLLVGHGASRAELRVTREADPAGDADIVFVGHAFSDIPQLLEVVRSGKSGDHETWKDAGPWRRTRSIPMSCAPRGNRQAHLPRQAPRPVEDRLRPGQRPGGRHPRGSTARIGGTGAAACGPAHGTNGGLDPASTGISTGEAWHAWLAGKKRLRASRPSGWG